MSGPEDKSPRRASEVGLRRGSKALGSPPTVGALAEPLVRDIDV